MQALVEEAGGWDAYKRLSTRALWFALSCRYTCCLTGQPFNVLQYLKTAEDMEEEQWRVTSIVLGAMEETMRRVTLHLQSQG